MKRAFSLAETALSLTLIGLLLLFVLNLFPSALVAQKTAEHRLTASSLARSLLEEQMDQAFGQLPVGLERTLPPVSSGGVEYQPRFTVTASPQADPKYLRVLRLEVRWEFRGQTRLVVREVWKHQLPHRQ